MRRKTRSRKKRKRRRRRSRRTNKKIQIIGSICPVLITCCTSRGIIISWSEGLGLNTEHLTSDESKWPWFPCERFQRTVGKETVAFDIVFRI